MNSTDSLWEALEHERGGSLQRQAVLIRNWKDGPDRAEAAKELIRKTFVECVTGQIRQETEAKIYSVLSFAMSEENPNSSDGYEDAVREQQRRQDCPECGEGGCMGA